MNKLPIRRMSSDCVTQCRELWSRCGRPAWHEVLG